MAYQTYNGTKLFSYDDSVDEKHRQYLQQKQAQQQQKSSSNPIESFFSWIGDTAGAIGNTVKDTVGAIASPFVTATQETKRTATIKSNQAKLDNIAKKYGFNSYNEISDDAWNNNQKMVNELKQATKENTDTLLKQGEDYKNNWAVKNTANVKQGDYGANAIKTWNTLADVLTAPVSMPANIAINAGQGYLSALGDEMQGKSDLSNINWGNVAKQGTANATAGVAGGVAGNAAGKLGSKMLGANNGLLRTSGKVLNTAPARGAVAGAAGGATGAGLGTAFEGGSLEQILANAATGAQQGAGTGAVAATGMSLLNSGANRAKNALGRGTEQPTAEIAQEDIVNPNKKSVLDNDQNTEIPDIERATGWSGDELSIKRKNILNRAGDAFEQTGDAIRNRNVLNKLYSKTADGVYERDSINRLRKLGYSPDSYGEAAKVSETTNKFIDEVIPKDLKVKSTALQDDLLKIRGNATIESAKIEKGINQRIAEALDNARSGNPNTMDEYDVRKLWKESKKLMDLSTSERKLGMNVNGDVTNPDHATAAEIYSNAAKQIRDIADGQVQWGDSFDKNILANRLKNLGATDADIKYLTEGTNSLAELKRKTSLYEDARQMDKEIGKSAIRRNAVSGTSTNPINIATQESGVGEIIRTAARPIGNTTGKITMGIGKALNKAGDIVSGTNRITSRAGDVANTVANAVTPQTDLPYALIGRLSGTEEGQEAAQNPQTYANPANLEQQLGNSAITPGNMGYSNYGTTMGADTGYGNGYSGTGNNMLDRLVIGMENALNAGDVSAFSQLAEIYNTLSKVYGVDTSDSAKQTKLTESQQKANAAMDTLNQLEAMGNDTGNYWMSSVPIIGGLLTDITGGNEYTSVADSLALQLGFMLSGANVPNDEKERIKRNYIPLPTDSDAVKARKIMLAKQIINNFQNGYSSTPTDETNSYAY